MDKLAWSTQHSASASVRRHVFRLFAALGFAALATAATAAPSMTACAVSGTVTVTVAGIGSPISLGCLNQATRSSPGTADQAAANVSIPSTAGIDNLGNIQTPESTVEYTTSPNAVTLAGSTKASSAQLVQGLVSAQDVRELMTCTLPAGGGNPVCQTSTTISSLMLGGQAQTLPSPIPINYSLPIQGNIVVKALGLLPITVPVSGVVVLNEITTTGTGAATQVQHSSIRVKVGGGLNVVSLGLVNVSIDVVDVQYCSSCINF